MKESFFYIDYLLSTSKTKTIRTQKPLKNFKRLISVIQFQSIIFVLNRRVRL